MASPDAWPGGICLVWVQSLGTVGYHRQLGEKDRAANMHVFA